MDAISNRTTGEWCEYPYEAVHQEILRRAGSPDLDVISEAARAAEIVFKECKAELVPALDAVLASGDDKILGELRKKAQSLKDHFTATDVVEALVGKRQFVSRDMRAMQGGVQAPHHVRVEAWAIEEASYGEQAAALGEIARHALRYLEKRKKMKGQSVARTEGPVFIGHGRSGAWKDLKSFLVERLHLDYEEFNRAPTAGRSTKERLLEMLDRCCFAFLVMTAEDEQVDGTKHPRLNVVHEAGLFQGRYGFERAIVLLEDGCEEFTNIEGLGQVRFPPGNIMAASEDVRRVLEREGILTTP